MFLMFRCLRMNKIWRKKMVWCYNNSRVSAYRIVSSKTNCLFLNRNGTIFKSIPLCHLRSTTNSSSLWEHASPLRYSKFNHWTKKNQHHNRKKTFLKFFILCLLRFTNFSYICYVHCDHGQFDTACDSIYHIIYALCWPFSTTNSKQ